MEEEEARKFAAGKAILEEERRQRKQEAGKEMRRLGRKGRREQNPRRSN